MTTNAVPFRNPTRVQRLARGLVFKRLGAIQDGTLCVRDAEGTAILGAPDAPPIAINVHDPVLWTDIATGGILGAGEAYAAGAWTTDDLPGVVHTFLRNRDLMGTMDSGLARAGQWFLGALQRLQPGSRAACRRFIAAHYDLGNEFFALFLDPSMTYSAGVFATPDTTMEEASRAKYERLAQKIGLQPGMRVLEIGCGWGGFAEHAARHHGCHVTGTTISEQQLTYARKRIQRAGLSDHVTILAEDYRDLRGTYDRIVSIEMIEAVGHRGLSTFARVCQERLAPDGMLALQAITLDDRHYDRARKGVDFIKRYIFPGSCIPSVKALHDAFTTHSDMRLFDLEDIGLDYVPTLASWRSRFLAHADEVRAMGFPDSFVRLWDYYFAYCEGGFRSRFLSDVQMVWGRPQTQGTPWRTRSAGEYGASVNEPEAERPSPATSPCQHEPMAS